MRKKIIYVALAACFVIIIALIVRETFSGNTSDKAFSESGDADEGFDLSELEESGTGLCIVLKSEIGSALIVRERSLESWDEIEELLYDIKSKYPDIVPVMYVSSSPASSRRGR